MVSQKARVQEAVILEEKAARRHEAVIRGYLPVSQAARSQEAFKQEEVLYCKSSCQNT